MPAEVWVECDGCPARVVKTAPDAVELDVHHADGRPPERRVYAPAAAKAFKDLPPDRVPGKK